MARAPAQRIAVKSYDGPAVHGPSVRKVMAPMVSLDESDETVPKAVSAQAYQQLLNEVNHLQTAVLELAERLAPILQDDSADNQPTVVEKAMDRWPEYFDNLRGLSVMVAGTREAVTSILHRLGLE